MWVNCLQGKRRSLESEIVEMFDLMSVELACSSSLVKLCCMSPERSRSIIGRSADHLKLGYRVADFTESSLSCGAVI